MRGALLRLRAILWRTRVESELEAELAEHLEREIEQLVRQGRTPAEARREAIATMGRLDEIKEGCREARGTTAWEHFQQDLSFGVRRLGRQRTFTAMALATMALGIGSATAGFSLIDGVLLRPLPFAAPEKLFAAEALGMRGPYATLRAQSRMVDYAAHLGVRAFNTPGREGLERQEGAEVSANFFRVLGVAPRLGRALVDGEDEPGRTRVAVLSDHFWRERFGGRSDAIGQKLQLDEQSFEIVGVMPAGFAYPAASVKVWVPMTLDPRNVGLYWGSGGVSVVGRLRDGVSLPAAVAEMRGWIPRIRSLFPWRMPDAWGTDADGVELREALVSGARVQAWLLFGVVALVLLIAVVNVANLLLGQTAARQAELTMRAALGATRGRLTRQLMTEGLLLATLGGALGAGAAAAQIAALKRLLPADTPRLAEVGLDLRAVCFSLAVAIMAGLLFGFAAARQKKRQRPATGHMLILSEAAFATILLVSAGLLLRSLWLLRQVDPGFAPSGVVIAEVSPSPALIASTAKAAALAGELRESLLAHPGVRHAAVMNVLPLSPEISAFTAAIEDHPRPPQAPQIPLWVTATTPEHLATLGVPLLQGRAFTMGDTAPSAPVVLISQAMARRFWPDRSPVGRRLRAVWQSEWRTIVGVVGDVKNYAMTGPPEWVEGEVYLPMTQAITPPPSLFVAARLAGDASAFSRRLPGLAREVCASCAVTRVLPLEAVVTSATRAPRSLAWLVTGFALLALAMAAIGIYGVVSQAITRRTRELGIRLALGASRGQMASLVLRDGLGATLLGIASGLGAAWLLARGIASLLYGVETHDFASFLAPGFVLLGVAVLASAGPLWRAWHIDPARALRE
ncbi:MAG: ABC transporter permease [Bryobacteraceae bacterium]|nr:ABC transporter permease [Bryobacteraceae bacterium]